MQLLYCDETNFSTVPGDFFVYGGVVVDSQKALALADRIAGIRTALGVPRDYLLKFNPGPERFSHQQFIDLKRAVMEAAVAADCKLLLNLCLHDIATTSEEARLFGVNTLCYHFDCFLTRVESAGLVLIDRFEDKALDGQVRERIAVGLTGKLPYGKELRLERIVGIHYTAIGQSHFCSVVDVILGSFRFCMNAFTQSQDAHAKSASTMLAQLAPLFVRDDNREVSDISLWFSPKEVRRGDYRERYLRAIAHLGKHGIAAAQRL